MNEIKMTSTARKLLGDGEHIMNNLLWHVETSIHAIVVLGGTFLVFAIPAVLLVAAIFRMIF